jgi:hypothetical protein
MSPKLPGRHLGDERDPRNLSLSFQVHRPHGGEKKQARRRGEPVSVLRKWGWSCHGVVTVVPEIQAMA